MTGVNQAQLTMTSPCRIRDHILDSLTPLKSPYNLGLTVLVSQPKKTSSIFPHTPNPPRCTQQEVLVVLSTDLALVSNHPTNTQHHAQSNNGSDGPSAHPHSTSSSTDQPVAEARSSSTAESAAPITPRVLVCAISAYLYTFPSSSPSTAPSPSAILYISKVDSSGYAPYPIPITRHFVRSFLTYYLVTLPRVRIQLFARAQRQYLFANSADGKTKKVLSGTGLCKWWKGVYEEAASELVRHRLAKEGKKADMKLAYILPGYEEAEARTMLGQGRALPAGVAWAYRPPFTDPVVAPSRSSTISSSSSSVLPPSLATLIPSLPDDPKTRFLEELVADAIPQYSIRSDEKQKDKDGKKSRKEREADEEQHARTEAHAALAKVFKDEFWERIGFRQECASGDVTGFFTLESEASPRAKAEPSSDASQPDVQVVHSTTPVEMDISTAKSEPAVFTTTSSVSISPTDTASKSTLQSSPKITDLAPAYVDTLAQPQPLLPPAIASRLLTALTNLDFASLSLAKEGTELWLRSTRSLVLSELGDSAWDQCTAIVRGTGVIPPTPTSNGSGLEVGAGGDASPLVNATAVSVKRDEPPVTMLQPRKKKK